MNRPHDSIENYIASIEPNEIQLKFINLRDAIIGNLPNGFEETMSYGMIGYVIPHTLYASGYHCNPKLPLPFINIAAQKNFIALYHMGIYADTNLLNWFVNAFTATSKTKLDMGKSCIRFKHNAEIPYELIGDLCTKMTPQNWIKTYESLYKNK